MSTSYAPPGPAESEDERRAEHRGWYLYDWAMSAFSTSVVTVFAGPYLTGLADAAADAEGLVRIGPVPVAASSFFLYAVSLSVAVQVVVLPVVGALADRSSDKRRLLAALALAGAAAVVGVFFATGAAYLLGGALLLVANVAFGSAAVVYDSFLPEIAGPDERDAVSSRGWALGYLGGGLLLAVHLALFLAGPFDESFAARVAIASAGIWWGGFTVVALARIRPRGPMVRDGGAGVGASFRQLATTLRGLRHQPRTIHYLVAFLLFNDGVATVIAAAAVFGADELELSQTILIGAILLVQFVAFGGALLLGRVAAVIGAKTTVLGALVVWSVVIFLGRLVPEQAPVPFLALSVAIGLVLGGTQALARSMFSQLVPEGKEAEFFGLYQITDRGTAWLGTFSLGLAVQLTGSYRSGLLVLLFFFVAGGGLLATLDLRRAISEAGNPVPELV